jgi:mitochondrial enoyl-[acyl-carrier protein] reductase / trans-2-enoyl-CoA reductase
MDCRRHRVKKNIAVVVYESHGKPNEVLNIVEQPRPEPEQDEVLVKMLAAPVNPADLNAIEGKYPGRPEVPATPGMEGVGIVEIAGAEVHDLQPATQVLLPHHVGTWREAVVVKAADVVAVPNGIDPIQAAMLKINPLTAWRLLHGYVTLNRGDWLIQNAANSGAGRSVMQIAKELGYKTINVVRRPELIEELKSEGAETVLLDDDNLRGAVKTATGGAPIRLGLNAVGGERALRLMNALAPGGTLVTFGAMSLQPLRIPNGLLIFKDLRFRGIWINKWYDNATRQERMEAFNPLFDLAKRGLLQSKVEKVYPLGEVLAAVAHASRPKRGGKILLTIG